MVRTSQGQLRPAKPKDQGEEQEFSITGNFSIIAETHNLGVSTLRGLSMHYWIVSDKAAGRPPAEGDSFALTVDWGIIKQYSPIAELQKNSLKTIHPEILSIRQLNQ